MRSSWWSNPVSGSLYGSVYIWVSGDGHPIAVASVIKWYSPRDRLEAELHSLIDAPIVGFLEGEQVWNSTRSGVEFHTIPNVNVSKDSVTLRLQQMTAGPDGSMTLSAADGTSTRSIATNLSLPVASADLLDSLNVTAGPDSCMTLSAADGLAGTIASGSIFIGSQPLQLLTNHANLLDVDANRNLDHNDAGIVLTLMSASSSHSTLPGSISANDQLFVDVNGDRRITAIDLVRVINGIERSRDSTTLHVANPQAKSTSTSMGKCPVGRYGGDTGGRWL